MICPVCKMNVVYSIDEANIKRYDMCYDCKEEVIPNDEPVREDKGL